MIYTVESLLDVEVFSGLDIKSYFESEEHLSTDCLNQNISIENSTFVDMGNAVVLSTIDRGLEYNDGVYFFFSPVSRPGPLRPPRKQERWESPSGAGSRPYRR